MVALAGSSPGAFEVDLLARMLPLVALVIGCAWSDVARGKVYNAVTLPALAYGVTFSAAVGGVRGAMAALLGAAAGLAIFGAVYLMKGLGGGDVKLMAAVGAIAADWRFVLLAAFYSALVGALIGLAFLIWRGRLWSGLKRSALLFLTLGRRPARETWRPEDTFPYAVAIAVGTLWALYEVLLPGGGAA